jgi:hypothetical protein
MKKVFYAVAKDLKVKDITANVLRYIDVLKFCYTATNPVLWPRTGIVPYCFRYLMGADFYLR